MADAIKGQYVSMTAFAQRDFELSGLSLQLTIQSVNHKSFSIRLRHPGAPKFEDELRKRIRHQVARGSVDFRLLVSTHEDSKDGDFLEWRKECGEKKLPLPSWGDFYARLSAEKSSSQNSKSWLESHSLAIGEEVDLLLRDYKEMAIAEADNLIVFLKGYHDNLKESLADLRGLLELEVQKNVEHFKTRLAKYGKELDVEARGDLARECASLLERLDVSEECDRLSKHLEVMEGALHVKARSGKVLDFLCQEIFREVNTLSNKIQSAEISQFCIEMKLNVEKIREQVQNIA